MQVLPQYTSIERLRAGWRDADAVGVDSIWLWDGFFPRYGPLRGAHYEAWSLLAAMALDTQRARIGVLVSAIGFRNPDLLAHMACTVDHLSGGRVDLGIGAGQSERDHLDYGYAFPSAVERVRSLESAVVRIRSRMTKLDPPPLGPMPLLIGGGGERATLRLVAEHADMWNSFGPPGRFAKKNAALDAWCAKVGRDPAEIERTVVWGGRAMVEDVERYLDAGATHLIFMFRYPFDVEPVQELLALAAD